MSRIVEPLEKTTFGFQSKRYPPAVEKLVNFEMLKMLILKKKLVYQNLVISKTIMHQEHLQNIKEFNKNNKKCVSADKSTHSSKWKKKNMRYYYLQM